MKHQSNTISQATPHLPFWVIILLVGLPQFSETVYTPALPDIARYMQVEEAWVEFTLTIYMWGFAIGSLFWGWISDKLGRRPSVIAGIIVYILGSIGCYFANTIEALLAFRFVQAFGGGVGSVLSQSMTRDVYHGAKLGQVYAAIASVLGIFPALGPLVGGFLTHYFSWHANFAALVIFGAFLVIILGIFLPETLPAEHRRTHPLLGVAKRLMADRKVLVFGALVASTNGIIFSYYAEGPFFLIDMLGLNPAQFGISSMLTAGGFIVGAMISKKLAKTVDQHKIIWWGILIDVFSALLFASIVLFSLVVSLSHTTLISATLVCLFFMTAGMPLIISNALSLALQDYKDVTGTASSLFGFFYYVLIALFIFFMGLLHNDTIIPMPLYLLGLTLLMLVLYWPYRK